MKFGLKEDIITQVNEIFAKYPQIEKAVIYGSRAKGNFKKGSDIDLTFEGDGLNLSVINSLLIEIDDLLLPYTFDISIFKSLYISLIYSFPLRSIFLSSFQLFI